MQGDDHASPSGLTRAVHGTERAESLSRRWSQSDRSHGAAEDHAAAGLSRDLGVVAAVFTVASFSLMFGLIGMLIAMVGWNAPMTGFKIGFFPAFLVITVSTWRAHSGQGAPWCFGYLVSIAMVLGGLWHSPLGVGLRAKVLAKTTPLPARPAAAAQPSTERRRQEQRELIQAPKRGKTVSFDFSVYPNEWSESIRIPANQTYAVSSVGPQGSAIYLMANDDKDRVYLDKKGTDKSLRKNVSSLRLKSGEVTPVRIRFTFPPAH